MKTKISLSTVCQKNVHDNESAAEKGRPITA